MFRRFRIHSDCYDREFKAKAAFEADVTACRADFHRFPDEEDPMRIQTRYLLLCLPRMAVLVMVLQLSPGITRAADFSEFVLLWPNGAPKAMGEAEADKPGMWVYPAENPNGAAIVICPGGGYSVHATDHEGVDPARYFNSIGVTAFVLRYRLSPYRHPVPLMDAQRAIRLIRAGRERWGIDETRVGIMGFSAGGHLTSTAVTHFDRGNADAEDVIERQSCRPDFGILGYPVVSFVAEYSHRGSGRNLLGENAAEADLQALSNDQHVTQETPPVFLFHTSEDLAVPPQNSLAFYAACHKAGVPAELHIFQQGPHGVGLAFEHPALEQWITLAGTWLRQNALLVGEKRTDVRGTVTLNGVPMKWGAIAFRPADLNAPTGWAPVRNGQFQIPASAGPVPGLHTITISDMGAVAPHPTHAGATLVNPQETLTWDVQPTGNEVVLELKSQ